MNWLAHSAKRDSPAQTYGDHIATAVAEARRIAAEASQGLAQEKAFVEMVALATEFHDMGKLGDENQRVLAAPTGKPLPCEHVDAGVKHLFSLGTHAACFAGILAYSHHRGLPDMLAQKVRDSKAWRSDEESQRFNVDEVIARTQALLPEYLNRHRQALGRDEIVTTLERYAPTPLDLRMGLSCLVDADHGDTARHYGEASIIPPQLRAADRLAALDTYVAGLGSGRGEQEVRRAEIRKALYTACRAANPSPSIYACDSPVGSGKTTAVMAHLLQAAVAKNLRRMFVVLPFTNIIDQSVGVYQDAFVLTDEAPEQVVVAHHHKSDFSNLITRNLTTRWQAPIVVTTAVQFFETLASNKTADLRKLHQIARSGIFIDEAHGALPAHLWPMAWKWLRLLTEQWGCHVVLASGSLPRFWSLPDFYETKAATDNVAVEQTVSLPQLVDHSLRSRMAGQEASRVNYRLHPKALGLDELIDFIASLPGPRLAVFNTVQTAAMVAIALAKRCGRNKVEHLSTALTPADRQLRLAWIKTRLTLKDDYLKGDWTLVATSLVEAGVDLSFRSGIRELSGLSSLLQLAGRVNRHGEYPDAEVWSVDLAETQGLRKHFAMQIPSRILSGLYAKNQVSPDSCTPALKQEIRERGNQSAVQALFLAEKEKRFPDVAEGFKVIASETLTALPSGPLLDAIIKGKRPSWKSLQMESVQIWTTRKVDFALSEVRGYPGLFTWNLDYNDFIGYMAGALKANEVKSGVVQII